MLVLSRKEDQTLVFPNLDIRVEILKVAGRTVRVGIKAPRDIRVLRGELDLNDDVGQSDTPERQHAATSNEHQIRNRLNRAKLALRFLQKQADSDCYEGNDETLATALASLNALESDLEHLGLVDNRCHANDFKTQKQTSDKRALLVEDDSNERKLLAGYLRASGFTVDTVSNGQEAIEYLAEKSADAILMDIEMPEMDGREAISRIHENADLDAVKIFVVSGLNRESIATECDSRISHWFQKPLEPQMLVNELAASLN